MNKSKKYTNKRNLTGVITSNKMSKTVVVKVTTKMQHPLYGKVVKKWKKYAADINKFEDLIVGDIVSIQESKNISKTKNWKVISKQS